jgi:hypothetical protein
LGWKEPASGDWIRTFAVITTDANEMVADIHDRMPVILAPGDYARWLSDEPDPRDLMRPFPASLMRMWPISQAGERRSVYCRAGGTDQRCGVAMPGCCIMIPRQREKFDPLTPGSQVRAPHGRGNRDQGNN